MERGEGGGGGQWCCVRADATVVFPEMMLRAVVPAIAGVVQGSAEELKADGQAGVVVGERERQEGGGSARMGGVSAGGRVVGGGGEWVRSMCAEAAVFEGVEM